MKPFLLLLLLFCSLTLTARLEARQAQLTFRVDMRQQTVSANGVHVAGSFQSETGLSADWLPSATPLTDTDGDQVYEATVQVPPGLYHYKFINGNSWSEQPESLSASCSVEDGAGNFNREVSVGSSSLRLPVVSFNGCTIQLILSVVMHDETVAAEGVHVAGNFQALAGYEGDWNPTATPLTDPDGDGIYQIRLALPVGGIFEYKFINGTSWEAAEQVPASCGTDDGNGNINRVVHATAPVNTAPAYCFSSCESCGAGSTPPLEYTTYWWNDAVFYEIFVRSFYDSNGDGKGDFKGLIQKLDYLNDGNPNTTTDLGITGIWLMPMMESPSYHGYDVTNYYAVEPDYGSMADFEAFLAAAHARGIKVIIDFVMNHTSSQHPWFTQSASSTTNPYRDWYIWSATNPGFRGPWNQEVWHLRNNNYYYGLFWGGMPDLNWSNPAVQEEMWDITRFWLEAGVDGYRLDAIKYLDEDGPQLENTPETFALLQEFNQVYKDAAPDALTVGEVWSGSYEVAPYVQDNRLDLAFEFDLSYSIINGVRSGNPSLISNQMAIIDRVYAPLQYATFLTNHDQNRILEEFGGNLAQMKQAASIYLTLPGVPFLYYGEEIGMLGTKPDEDIRRPMQWTPGNKAGFTTGTPWHHLNNNYTEFNVQTLAADASSLLTHYKRFIHLRNQQPALRRGYYAPLTNTTQDLLSYTRIYENEAVVVLSNFGSSPFTNPSLSLELSSLPAGVYSIIDLASTTVVGEAVVNEQGGISNLLAPVSLPPNETAVLLISNTTQEPTGLTDKEAIAALTLYPNPANGSVRVELEGQEQHRHVLRVYSPIGELLLTTHFSGNNHTIPTTAWPNGTYLISLQSGSKVVTERLVILR